MRQPKFVLVVILRFVGVTGLFALPAVFLPHAWMDSIHGYLGLGSLPDEAIVGYLARSLSAFYWAFAVITLYISWDVERYRSIVALWGLLFVFLGVLLLGIDISAGMPLLWTLLEGPPTILVGFIVIWLQRRLAMPQQQ